MTDLDGGVMALIHSGTRQTLSGEDTMGDEPVELTEYEDVEVRPGIFTSYSLNDADAERLGLKGATAEPEAKPAAKNRAAANKARTAENK